MSDNHIKVKPPKVKKYEGDEPTVFVSYSHKDAEIVNPVIEWLANSGFRVWYDAGLEAGTAHSWKAQIAKCVKSAQCVLAFSSNSFAQSENTAKELELASQRKIPVAFVSIEKYDLFADQLPEGSAYDHSGAQAINKWSMEDKDFREELADSLPKETREMKDFDWNSLILDTFQRENMTKEQVVLDDIQTCLKSMQKIKVGAFDGIWRDSENEPGAVMTMEAFLCYLIPLVDIEDQDVKKCIFQAYASDNKAKTGKEELKRDVVNFLNTEKNLYPENSEISQRLNDNLNTFSGYPYISIKSQSEEKNGFLDTACMAVSTIIYFYGVYKTDSLENDDRKAINGLFDRAIKFVCDSYLEEGKYGWTFTDQANSLEFKSDFSYCTWMGLETLSDIQSIDSISSTFKVKTAGIRAQYKEMAKDLTECYFNENDREGKVSITGKIWDGGDGIRDTYYSYNIWALLAMLHTGAGRLDLIRKAIDYLYEQLVMKADVNKLAKMKEENQWNFTKFADDNDIINTGTDTFTDRAMFPQFMKTMVMYASVDTKNVSADFYDHLDNLYDIIRNHDCKENDIAKSPLPIWDNTAENGYSIYYTERVIEALVKYYSIVKETNNKTDVSNNSLPILLSEDTVNKLRELLGINKLETELEELKNSKSKESNSDVETLNGIKEVIKELK